MIKNVLMCKKYVARIGLIMLIMASSILECHAQAHLTFMGIPITGKREAMLSKLRAKGFTEKTQENEVAVELKGRYLNRPVYLRVYNSNVSQTVYLIDVFFPTGKFWDIYDQYIYYRKRFTRIYGKPTDIIDDDLEEMEDADFEDPIFGTYYESSKGLVSIDIAKNRIEISFQDKRNAQIMRREKPKEETIEINSTTKK